jgi:hypothetical protein
MPEGKSKKKKPAHRKPAEKAIIKKTTGKKTARKKIAKKKAAVKKKASKKKTVAKTRSNRGQTVPTKSFTVEPGPPPGNIPPVEEPASHQEAIATVTHYYSHLGVAVVQLNKGTLRTGDTIHVTGHSTDFTQKVESIEYEHQHVDQASAGQTIGLLVKDHTREHDIVYLVK